ncbi:MAG: peptidylprolyl isomerase, partial [Bdellovibrionota bacterium]
MNPTFLFLFAFLMASTGARAEPVSFERIEAFVNSRLIFTSDVRLFRKTIDLRTQLDPLFTGTPVAQAGKSASHSDVVDFLIDETVIAQQFPVTDAEVEQVINEIQATNHLDRPGLKAALKEQGYVFDDYFELIRSSTAKRNLIDRDIRIKVVVSEDDIKNHFFNRLGRASAGSANYQLRLITVTPLNFKTPAAALDTANRALKQIRSGEAFEDVAKRVSDDAVAAAGGDLGAVTEDHLSGPIREQLKKLKIGEVSDLFGS